MKFWYGHGSEHSMNLVMIGQFKDAADAAKANQVIEWLTEEVNADIEAGVVKVGEGTARFSERMLEILRKVNIYTLGSVELEQFAYDVRVELKGDQIVMTTDEVDVSAFLKVMLDKGARVEVYSAHDYPGTGHGRGT